MPELPPPSVVREAEKARAELQRRSRELAPPPFALLELAMGSMVTQALYAAARLGIAEQLQDGPLPPEQIAQRVGAVRAGQRRSGRERVRSAVRRSLLSRRRRRYIRDLRLRLTARVGSPAPRTGEHAAYPDGMGRDRGARADPLRIE